MKKYISVFLIALMMISLFACGGAVKPEAVTFTEEPKVTEAPTPEPTPEPVYKVGDTVETDWAKLTVKSVSVVESYHSRGSTTKTTKAGHRFIEIYCSLVNTGKTTYSYFTNRTGGRTCMTKDIVYIDYNEGFLFDCKDVQNTSHGNYGDSMFYTPTSNYMELEPLSGEFRFFVTICVPEEVITNTAAPLLLKCILQNSKNEPETFSFDLRNSKLEKEQVKGEENWYTR